MTSQRVMPSTISSIVPRSIRMASVVAVPATIASLGVSVWFGSRTQPDRTKNEPLRAGSRQPGPLCVVYAAETVAHRVTLIPGDGIGPEVAAAAQRVAAASGVEIDWVVQDAGQAVM